MREKRCDAQGVWTGRDLSVHDLCGNCDFISYQIGNFDLCGNCDFYFQSNFDYLFWLELWNLFQFSESLILKGIMILFQFFNPSIIFASNIMRDRSRPVRTRFVREL